MASSTRIGVILAQIGTPSAPEARSVRLYLRRFLSDRRIVDTHPLLWQPVLRGIILRTRPRRSARLYQQIWSEEGSPLWVYSRSSSLNCRKGWDPNIRSSWALLIVNTVLYEPWRLWSRRESTVF